MQTADGVAQLPVLRLTFAAVQWLHLLPGRLCDIARPAPLPEGGEIEVSLREEDEGAILEVADTGIGIEPRDQGRIFERFYRADKHRSTEAGGTGLGLSIVKNIVAAHGGEVSVESVPGRGSTFRVRIPLVPTSV